MKSRRKSERARLHPKTQAVLGICRERFKLGPWRPKFPSVINGESRTPLGHCSAFQQAALLCASFSQSSAAPELFFSRVGCFLSSLCLCHSLLSSDLSYSSSSVFRLKLFARHCSLDIGPYQSLLPTCKCSKLPFSLLHSLCYPPSFA